MSINLDPKLQSRLDKLDDTRREHIRRIQNSESKYLYREDPKKTIKNICVYCLHRFEHQSAFEARRMFRNFKFDLLYENGQWETLFDETLEQLQKKFDPSRRQRHKIFSCVLEYELMQEIPDSQLSPDTNPELSTLKQTLKYSELVYVLRTITQKIISKFSLTDERCAILSNRYFLGEEFKANYKKAAGRRINGRKLSVITELLFKYHFIVKTKVKRDDARWKCNQFSLGQRNYYKDLAKI